MTNMMPMGQQRADWRSRTHGREWNLTFERYAFPRIGKMPVSEVTSTHVMKIFTPISPAWDRILEGAISFHETRPRLPTGKRGRKKRRTGHNLQLRSASRRKRRDACTS